MTLICKYETIAVQPGVQKFVEVTFRTRNIIMYRQA